MDLSIEQLRCNLQFSWVVLLKFTLFGIKMALEIIENNFIVDIDLEFYRFKDKARIF